MANVDARGIRRGSCTACSCDSYDRGLAGKKCEDCGHPPGKHSNLDFPAARKDLGRDLGAAEGVNANFGQEPSDLYVSSSLDETGPPPLEDEEPVPILAPQITPLKLDDRETCCYPGCHKPRFRDKDKIHPFCSRSHASLYRQQDHQTIEQEMCKTLGCKNFRYRDSNGQTFDYCSKNCRDNQSKDVLPVLQGEELGECNLPNCTKPRYQDSANGRIHLFCSRSHASEATRTGITTSDSKISLVELTTTDAGQKVSTTFRNSWAPQKGQCPDISFIFSVVNTSLRQRWHRYKDGLSNKDVCDYFHGTTLVCDITRQQALCSDSSCGVCGIANIGFDRRCIRKNINFQRFGHGFYVAPNSSKCHDYTQGKHGYRAMLLFEICPGDTYVLQRDDETLTEPPEGYNSVHGKAGQSLNYDELVLYNPDGAFPKYIIVYQRDGEERIAKNLKSTNKIAKPPKK